MPTDSLPALPAPVPVSVPLRLFYSHHSRIPSHAAHLPAALNPSPLLGLRVFLIPLLASVGLGGFSGGCSGTIIKPVFSEFFPRRV